ncbi:SIMPL domain-containing protein [Actinoplanes sp. G11-F43]|uniref:SIMPL domain-containing protein n=1 Tax=Actinoplanes sp. G11-F43 TaxID=3424130 RepID=UPI003D33F6F4
MNRSLSTRSALVALATTGTLLLGSPALADTDPPWESVQVSGTGEVFGEPDKLTANLAAETTAPTVAAALNGTTAAAAKMRDALVKAGIAKVDLQTSNVDVEAKTDDDGKITGYTVNQGVTVTIRNLTKAGTILSDTITAGGDAARLNGVSFGIEDESGLLNQARKRAFGTARGKAELFAKEAGRPLGRVLKVTETTPGWGGGGEQYKAMAAFAADASLPIEPGRQRLSVTVSVEWALDTSTSAK